MGRHTYIIIYALSSLFFFNSCRSTKQVTQKTSPETEKSSGIELLSLKATNLSEDGTLLSSGNDEIFLSVNFFIKEGNVYVNRYNKFYGSWTFNKKSLERTINEQFKLKKKTLKGGLLVFTLVELDENNRENMLNEDVKLELLEQLNGTGGSINEKKIESILKGNDLLGVKLIKLSEVNASLITTEFSGSVALDKYDYLLNWKLF